MTALIAMAKADNHICEIEREFLLAIAMQMGISEIEFEILLENPIPHQPPQTFLEKVVQFHRLVLVMNVNGRNTPEELNTLYKIALRMGISDETVGLILKEMTQYENKVIPPDRLISIFNVQLN